MEIEINKVKLDIKREKATETIIYTFSDFIFNLFKILFVIIKKNSKNKNREFLFRIFHLY